MKKFTTAADLGLAPIYKSDLRTLFNVEIWDAIQGILSPFNSDTEGIILQGCAVTNNAGNFDIASGIVYLNGEFMRVSAVTNAPFTRYIAPDAPISDSRTFQDGTIHAVMITKTASIYSAAPGSGQYITISSLTDSNDRRWTNLIKNAVTWAGSRVITKIVNLPVWDMDATSSVSINHGLSTNELGRITSIDVIIRQDAVNQPGRLFAVSGGVAGGFLSGSSTTILSFTRTAAGTYDDPSYSSTAFSRGRVMISYIPD